MKIVSVRRRWLRRLSALLLLLALGALYLAASRALSGGGAAALAGGGWQSADRARSLLLMQAMDRVGACDPQEAAEVWASGLKERSAALQYAVMTAELKAEYALQLKTSAPNWVTGLSSPWVERYQIEAIAAPDENSRMVRILFSTATSTGPDAEYAAILALAREGRFWRITAMAADEGLYPYTRFQPETR